MTTRWCMPSQQERRGGVASLMETDLADAGAAEQRAPVVVVGVPVDGVGEEQILALHDGLPRVD